MQQRVGNRYWIVPKALTESKLKYCKDASMNFECAVANEQSDIVAATAKQNAIIEESAIWTRIEAAHSHVQPENVTGAQYDIDQAKIQAGIDGLIYEDDSGNSLIAGINVFYGEVGLNANSTVGDGSTMTAGYGVGATMTWLNVDGFYVDLQGQYGRNKSDLTSETLGRLATDVDGEGYALSAEIGKKVDLDQNWTATPQAQLTYSSVDFESFTGPFDERISLYDTASLKLRLGIAASRDKIWLDDVAQTQRSHVYAVANLIREFDDQTVVEIDGTKLSSQPDQWTGELGLGFTRNINDDKYSVYGEINVASSLESFATSYRLGGTLGMRLSF